MTMLSDGETDAGDRSKKHDCDMHANVHKAHIVVVGADLKVMLKFSLFYVNKQALKVKNEADKELANIGSEVYDLNYIKKRIIEISISFSNQDVLLTFH